MSNDAVHNQIHGAAITEEYTVVNRQIEPMIEAVQKLRLERKAADLLAEVERADAELQR